MGTEYREVKAGDLRATHEARLRAPRPPTWESWCWIYGQNPAGRRACAAFDGDEVVAHFGLLPRRTWSAGKERQYAEVIDVFETTPDRGLVALTARAALEAEEDRGDPGAPLVVHAWPERAEARLLTRLFSFETVRTDPWLLGSTGESDVLPAGVDVQVRFGEDARWLWDRCAGDFGASTIRDASFLNWRFVDRPQGAAPVLGVRDAEGVLRGYVVWEVGGDEEPETARILDFLCPPDEPEVGEALLAGARAAARAAGVAVLGTLLVPWSPWFERFQRRGFGVHSRSSFLLARSSLRKFDDLWLRDGWWYTLADAIEGGACTPG